MSATSTTMTIRLEKDIKNRFDHLAKLSNRTKSFLAADAIVKYIELNEWQMHEIETAVNEADKGDFASKEQLNDFYKKWAIESEGKDS